MSNFLFVLVWLILFLYFSISNLFIIKLIYNYKIDKINSYLVSHHKLPKDDFVINK